MSNTWEAGATPWLRRHQPETTWANEPNPVQCMFCGGQTVKRSESDRSRDTGRIELYCDNGSCDAREMVLLVRRDGADAYARADVRALNLIDNGTLDVHAAFPPQVKSSTMADLMADYGNEVERRMRKPSRSAE
ncbi:hypothetical protein [Streptomyces daghestanicus]|uniref:Uncharacterized protein n=1 Tax=Streptomyces daghestanicus TaxID=66885 RepID=A0ABQ3Q7Q9_9ACTN|nr:hypothetical protein [Streptomyces daghestanicus]GGU62594.1 hypothetical protein GCM10010259_61540 [Streptomyces daghestanicus]GHI33308.1 hypothetical protein Sdagh_50380 [Streptomyces daghestanicus]